MRIEVRLFGGLADRIGSPRATVEVADDATVADLRAAVAAAHPELGPLLARVNVAVDLEVAPADRPLAGTREVALLPPVAGGAEPPQADPAAQPGSDTASGRVVDRERHGVRIVTGLVSPPLALDATIERVTGPDVGGTAVFLGTVRDHAPDLDEVTGLDYSAYPEMAERVLATIADELVADHPDVRGIALLHSVGELAVGDHTILIVCTAAHRHAAFDACRDALERVKERVPVWKRERTADGDARWVGLPGPAGHPAG